MSNQKLATIIIDNYNYERYLGQTIDSALSQNYSNIEVIVVDDGSTDRSGEIISSYGDKITVVLKPNGGQASAFNAGFRKSRGEVIFFLDSDDILFPDAVKNAVHLFVEYELVKVQWPLWVIDEDGVKTGATRPPQVPNDGDLRDVVLRGGPTSCVSSPTSGNAWARHYLEKVLPMPEDVAYYKVCADEYLYTLAPVFGLIKTISKPQGLYRVHGKNIYSSRTFEEKLQLELSGHKQQTEVLTRVLKKWGINIDEDLWRRNSWFHRLALSIEEIATCIPQEDVFILVDDETWNVREIYPGRTVLPFLERDGQYWGSPENDNIAIQEINRLRDVGARFIVFTWPSFWWFDHYAEFNIYLRANFKCVLENERIIVFDLRNTL